MKNHHTTKKGAYMSDREQSPMHTAKTPSHRTGIFATRRALLRGQGTGAPAAKLLALLTISLLALFAATASASAAPPSAKTPEVSEVTYTSVQVKGKISSSCEGFLGATERSFEYATSESGPWTPGYTPANIIACAPGFTDKEFEGTIEGLKGGTKYFVRLIVRNNGEEGISPEPHPSFTTLAVDPPTIPGTVEASPVFSTSAKATGKVIRPANPADPKPGADAAFDVKCHFDYIADAQYQDNITSIGPDAGFTGATSVDCTQNPIKAADAGKEKDVNAEFAPGSLTPSTTYHLRLVAENAAPGGPVIKEAANFTTAPKVAAPSVTAVNDASEVKFNVATLSGKVLRPAGADPALDVNCKFEYVTDAKFQPLSEQQNLTLTNATGGTYALSFAGETTAPIAFDASAAQVQSALELLSAIGPGNVSVSGSYTIDFTGALAGKDVEQIFVDPSALEEAGVASAETTTVTEGHVGGFESPKTADCEQNAIKAAGENPVSAKAGLLPTTKYHFRLVAENEGGSDTMDAANTFTTPQAEKPVVTIDPVEGGTFTTAHVSGTVEVDDPGRGGATVRFEISTDNFNWSGGKEFNGGSIDFPFGVAVNKEADFTGLQPSTTYFFRISSKYATNSWEEGEANGEVERSPEPNPEITTEPPQAPPTAENLAVTGVTATTAHFSGTVNPNAPAGPLSGPAKKAYETKWHFECVPECLDANENVIGGAVQGEAGPQTVTGDVTRLEPNTDYTVSLIVSSGIDGEPAVETFPTDKSPPSVKQTSGSSDGTGGYNLEGIVNPNNETITDCKFEWGPDAPSYAFKADCSPLSLAGSKPITVEAHLTGLDPDAIYHSLLVVTYGGGLKADSGKDQEFKPILAVKEPCPANEQQRIENSSLALPECRAYEMVTPPGKEGFGAVFGLIGSRPAYDGGDRFGYTSEAGNIAKSGQGGINNKYVAARTESGWQTIPDLNGSSGSLRDAPLDVDSPYSYTNFLAYSQDLLSSVWLLHRQGEPGGPEGPVVHLRAPDGTFAIIGNNEGNGNLKNFAASTDLSHFLIWSVPGIWGPGVYEFLGTGMDQPRRVDLDNSDAPVSSCTSSSANAVGLTISSDGGTALYKASGALNAVPGTCGPDDPAADEIWARVDGTTAVDVSASHCERVAPLACNAPSNPTFEGAASDGSRVFFTTTQQLVDADTDLTSDLYACDLPTGNPAPTADKANSCTAFRQISVPEVGSAEVESVFSRTLSSTASALYPGVSDDGSTVLFLAKGKLADNEDTLGEQAVAGDHNLYVWRSTDDNPDGQTTFVARLEKNDVGTGPQLTSDGRYLVFTTASQLLDTDTDTARDVYRYDADTGELTRVSTNVFGVAGNGNIDAQISAPAERHPSTAISADGQKIVFTTAEPLDLAVDNNDESDVYLWTPAHGFLISTGAVQKGGSGAYITASGHDIYFGTGGALTPDDGDSSADIYDARIGGGFSFAPEPVCAGETCKPSASTPPAVPTPAANRPKGIGNVVPKTCPKGKILKGKKCVKKNKHKKHSDKKHHGKKHKRAGSNGGGGK